MTVNEVKDALEPVGHVLMHERRIAHGTQLCYRPRILVNIYDTGKYIVQRDTKNIKETLQQKQAMLDQGRGLIPPGLPHPQSVSVSSVKDVLRCAGHSVKFAKRLSDDSGTMLKIVGGVAVIVYDSGLLRAQGVHKAWIEVLLNEAFCMTNKANH